MIKGAAYIAEGLLEHAEIHQHAAGVELHSTRMRHDPVVVTVQTFTLSMIVR